MTKKHYHCFELLPSWQSLWTVQQTKTSLPGFVWKGAGWYNYKEGKFLIIPEYSTGSWGATCQPGEKFLVCDYGQACPAEWINLLANAPVRY